MKVEEIIDALKKRIAQIDDSLSVLESANNVKYDLKETIHNYEVIKEELQTFLDCITRIETIDKEDENR
jgi:hypothetical protein